MADPSAYVCKLSPELQHKAKIELNETPETRTEGLTKMYEMLRARPDITCPTDVLFILGFLRARKFEVDRAFKLLENWCKARSELTEVFTDYYPSSVKELLECGVVTMLPTRDQEGRKVGIMRPKKWDVKKFGVWDVMKIGMMSYDMILRDEETQINGVVDLMDLEGFTMSHLSQFGPRMAMKAAPIMNQDTLPIRMKSMNALNESGFFDALFAIIKPFLKEKIKKRMHVHGEDLTTLHEEISSSALPVEYGGSAGSIEDSSKKWADYILSKENEFLAMKDYGVKRSDLGSKTVDDAATMEGLTGKYKKLDV
ncbi:alpha-tocopherol transfer protein-like [Ptychodera flava]|uniref:alpha-tocopherol transfer protein-like n=1 Tax=Ptychodera flava TaxID=63121 RepID=UPI00396A383C